jgi:WhiB family redox-sensing transcriptional regulator
MAASVTDTGRTPWMSEGACRGEDPDLFFPIGEGSASSGQIEQAVSICHGCDVETACLRFALTNGIKDGIWGGRTEQERLAMIRAYRAHRPRRAPLRPPGRRA